jgi:hypothetical protein
MPNTLSTWITVVSGLPRSGTSMMMRMLEAGGLPVLTDRVRKPDEDNPNGYYEFEPVKQLRRDAGWLAGAAGKAVKVVYRLLQDLPPHYAYRAIFLERRLEEVLASQTVMLVRNRGGHGAADNARLAESFRRELERTKSWLRQQRNFSVLYLNYHDVVGDPLAAAEAVDRFLRAGLDTRAMAGVVDAGLYRNRARPGDGLEQVQTER